VNQPEHAPKIACWTCREWQHLAGVIGLCRPREIVSAASNACGQWQRQAAPVTQDKPQPSHHDSTPANT